MYEGVVCKMKILGICQRCKKNKATIEYTEGALAFAHGFVEYICKECFDKMQKATPLYKRGFEDGKKWKIKQKKN